MSKTMASAMLAGALLLGFMGTGHAGEAVPTMAAAAGGFDVQAASEAYMAQIPAAKRASSDAYFGGGYWLLLWNVLIAVGVAWLLLGTRLSARMRDFAERRTRFKWLQTVIYAMQYFVLTALITAPWAYYEGFVREHQYGLSTQDLAGWASDQVTSLLVTVVLGSLLLAVIYAVIRRSPRAWWLWGAGVSVAFVVFLGTIAPVFLAPLFNTYKPLDDSPLKTEILSMAKRHGIPAENVYWFDASRQSNRISANVSGMFGTTRISLNDNLLKRTSPETVKAVLGHEMGHYVLGHMYTQVAFLAVMLFLGFAFVRWAFGRVLSRFGERWSVRGIGDVAGLPLVIALFSVFSFAVTPIDNTMTRIGEEQADAFGLDAAREPDGFAQAAVLLAEYRKMRPGPVEEALFHDHPSGWNRIHRSMEWKARHLGATAASAAAQPDAAP